MKLKKLTIDNVASIEHAEINFDKAPLANERLFLICGETGAGKSTIIDCICLALYGNTPRLKTAKTTKYDTRSSEGNKEEITTTNPKQLMRRGSVQASVTLTFDDNEGTPYVATWEVHRSHNKAEGRVLDATRTIQTEEGVVPAVLKTKSKEIEQYIKDLLGLTVDEFFRTVVLAQGKFAEFLNSGEKEKSDLLEKLTGTKIYSQISRKIYDICQDKARHCTILRGQMENIILLTDEQKEQINNELAQCSQQQIALNQQFEDAKKMLNWLNDMDNNNRESAEAQTELKNKLNDAASPACRTEEALISDWEKTSEIRQQLRRQQEAQNRIQTLEQERPLLQEKFDWLCSALRSASADLENKQKQCDEIKLLLQKEENNKEMYGAITHIKSLIARLDKAQKNIVNDTQDLEKDQERLPIAEKAVEEAHKSCQEQEHIVEEFKRQYEALNADKIIAQKDLLNEAKQLLNVLITKQEAVTEVQNALKESNKNRQDEQANLVKLNASIEGKRTIEAQAREAVERQKDWNALLIQAHKSLHKGDTCPVCGNTIERMLVPKSEDELNQLQQQHLAALHDLQQSEILIKTVEGRIQDYNKQISAKENDLKKKINDCDTHWLKTHQVLEKCGIKADEMPLQSQAHSFITDIDTQTNLLNSQLKRAQDMSDQINDSQALLTQFIKRHNQATIALKTITESISAQTKMIENSRVEVNSLIDELNSLIAIKDWQKRHETDAGFIDTLEKEATRYQHMEETHQRLNENISLLRSAIPTMEKFKASISYLTDHGLHIDEVPQNSDKQWHEFETDYLKWNTQLSGEQDHAEKAKLELSDYLKRHPGITLERLVELEQYQQEQIANIKTSRQALHDTISTMKGKVEALEKRHKDLIAQKPDFNEQNKEKLNEIIEEKRGTLEGLNNHMAELKVQLATDAANLKRMGSKQRELEQAEAEHRQWDQFNQMLGSADGTKLRNIAQSYILGELLAHANDYLQQFNNRYALEANPGSLTILARDLIQGDLTSVTTLSGGESFMVSLALALALSGLSGKLFNMDILFIDEGFGSLSPNYLDNVMETLNRLYDMGGRRVGIISHVEMLKERVTTQIHVYRDPENNTVSRVRTATI